MRLAIVRRRLASAGGAERFIAETTRALQSAGIDVTLISEAVEDGAGPVADWVRLPASRGSRAAKARAFIASARDAMRSGAYDVVQTHERLTGAHVFRAGDGVHAAWVDRLKRERAFWRRPFLDLDPFHRLLIAEERAMVRDGTVFVANSPMVAREIADWLAVPTSRIRVIENGVDLALFRPPGPGERAAARAALGFRAEDHVVAFVGSGFERKGAFALAQALGLPAMRSVKAVFAGRDKQADRLTGIVQSEGRTADVRLPGAVAEIVPVLHAADLLALPTLYDPMPNAALEAIACGLPVVTTADAGIADAVRTTGAGAVTTRKPDDIAAGIGATFARLDAARQAALGLRERFDIGARTADWIALYKEIAGR